MNMCFLGNHSVVVAKRCFPVLLFSCSQYQVNVVLITPAQKYELWLKRFKKQDALGVSYVNKSHHTNGQIGTFLTSLAASVTTTNSKVNGITVNGPELVYWPVSSVPQPDGKRQPKILCLEFESDHFETPAFTNCSWSSGCNTCCFTDKRETQQRGSSVSIFSQTKIV